MTCTRCMELQAQVDELEADLRSKRATISRLRGRDDTPQITEDVRAVFDYWRQACGHPHAKLDAKRAKLIAARLRTYGLKRCMRAIDGAAYAPARNEATGKPYDQIDLIMRNTEKFESFESRAPASSPMDTVRRLVGA